MKNKQCIKTMGRDFPVELKKIVYSIFKSTQIFVEKFLVVILFTQRFWLFTLE